MEAVSEVKRAYPEPLSSDIWMDVKIYKPFFYENIGQQFLVLIDARWPLLVVWGRIDDDTTGWIKPQPWLNITHWMHIPDRPSKD